MAWRIRWVAQLISQQITLRRPGGAVGHGAGARAEPLLVLAPHVADPNALVACETAAAQAVIGNMLAVRRKGVATNHLVPGVVDLILEIIQRKGSGVLVTRLPKAEEIPSPATSGLRKPQPVLGRD